MKLEVTTEEANELCYLISQERADESTPRGEWLWKLHDRIQDQINEETKENA